MKKLLAVIMMLVLLSGCAVQETFETVSDEYSVPTTVPPVQQLLLELPDEAASPTMENDQGKLYVCDNYCVTVHTVQAGDLNKTLKQTTGFTRDELTLFETDANEWKRYECVWTTAGEGGSQVCRGVILDDGEYHYVVTVMANESVAGDLALQWQALLNSACLVSTD